MTWLVKLELSLECDSLVRLVSILRSKIWVGLLQVKIVWFKLIIFLTLIFGWKNEKQPSGPIELDLEAGNLVLNSCSFQRWGLSFWNLYSILLTQALACQGR